MKYVPHDYQAYATDFILTHPEAAVLLDMGLGKSVITLTALRFGLKYRHARKHSVRTLIPCDFQIVSRERHMPPPDSCQIDSING